MARFGGGLVSFGGQVAAESWPVGLGLFGGGSWVGWWLEEGRLGVWWPKV